MSTADAFAPVFPAPVALPRGPHALSREEVTAAQRERVLRAVTEVVADRGFAKTTIAAIARAAGVSPNVFYEHFADKEDCYLAAYDRFAQTLLERIAGEIAPTTQWQEFLRNALDAYLGTVGAEPVASRAFILEMDSAGPRAREIRQGVYRGMAAVIEQRHRELVDTDPLPSAAYMGIVHGVRCLVCDFLEGRTDSTLTELSDEIERWLAATLSPATESSP
jgi:AcrR family transcriptional regulator